VCGSSIVVDTSNLSFVSFTTYFGMAPLQWNMDDQHAHHLHSSMKMLDRCGHPFFKDTVWKLLISLIFGQALVTQPF
jgi:hypothetical protein